jgi:hypothetical protein
MPVFRRQHSEFIVRLSLLSRDCRKAKNGMRNHKAGCVLNKCGVDHVKNQGGTSFMKLFFVLINCVALAGAALAQTPDIPKKGKAKNAEEAEAPPPVSKPAATVKSGATRSRQSRVISPAVQQPQFGGAKPRVQQSQRNLSGAPVRRTPATQRNVTRYQSRQFKLQKEPKPEIASAKFDASRRIRGSENWQGARYQAFRSYRPQWHDRDWWHHHHHRIIFVFGGWYFWDASYWYPAWGYDPYGYYAYDGPIYAYNDLPPDQVVANVQAALQEQGYYTGEVDGLLGPLTRAAIARYQQDHGLYITSAIDEPTLASLGMV